ncbi:hypothetical protein D3C74_417000 [compost metagenome]
MGEHWHRHRFDIIGQHIISLPDERVALGSTKQREPGTGACTQLDGWRLACRFNNCDDVTQQVIADSYRCSQPLQLLNFTPGCYRRRFQ